MNKPGQPLGGALYATLIRPEHISNLPSLNAEQKPKTMSTVQQLWSILEGRPGDSVEHKAALQRLQLLSNNIRTAHNNWKNNQQQRQSAMAAQAQQGQNQAQQGQVNPNQQQQQQAQQQAQQHAQQQAQMQRQAQAGSNQQMPGQGQPHSAAVLKHVQEYMFVNPTERPVGTPEGDKWLENTKRAYAALLTKMESSGAALRKLGSEIERLKLAGQEVPQGFLNQKQQVENVYDSLKKQVDGFRQQQAQLKSKQQMQKAAAEAKSNAGNAAAQNMQVNDDSPQFKLQLPGQQGQSTQGQGQSAPTVIAPNLALSQARNAGNVRNSQSPVAANQQQQQFQQQQIAGNTSFPQQTAQGQPGRPALNTQQPVQANAGPQSAGGQNSNGLPVALTHNAAMSAAARSYSDQQRTPQPSASQSYAPPSRPPTDQTNQPRMTIPKSLPQSTVDRPTAVSMSTPRPTLGGTNSGVMGVMSQPVIVKQPVFQLEGELNSGVLSKKKLDELVRQVTGGTETLSPEVEELMMEVADEFVDNVILAACRMARLRDDSQLSIADLQHVLERNYNIRIPGYSSDDVRVVRKVNPAPAWSQKMNAINAAKASKAVNEDEDGPDEA